MKRHLTYFLAAIMAVVSFGCSSDDVGQPGDMELNIQLTLASQSNTRGGRPLEEVDNGQHVTAVRVYIFRSQEENGEYTLYQPQNTDNEGQPQTIQYIDIEAFRKAAYQSPADVYRESQFEQHTVVIRPKLPDGYYRLLAIGVDENTSLFDVITTDSKWDDIVKTFDGPIYEEFFSGYSETVHISSATDKTHISIELKRCVSGVLLYVKNVPTTYKGKEVSNIRLILSGYSKTTDIVNRTWKSYEETSAGEGSSEGDEEASETDQLPEVLVRSEIELINFNEDAKEEATDEGKRYYCGKFVLPSNTAAILDKPTMKLVYYYKEKNKEEVLATKNVVLMGNWDNENESDYDFDYTDPDLGVDKKRIHYNLLANHIYCIGFRSETKKEPIDLSEESDEVKIIALGSWQADVDIEL